MKRFIRYERYKDSGVEWIGEIPEHWGISKIKYLPKYGHNNFIDGDWIESPYITNEGIRLLQTGNIGVGVFKEQGYRYISKETFRNLSCTEVYPNDVLICRLAHPVGRACLAPELENRMITSVDVCILRPKDDIDKKYLVYYLSSNGYLEEMENQSRGSTRQRISRTQLGEVCVTLPPFLEQQAIANFLDQKNAEIDSLIADKEKLIELLQEQRQGIITQAVTKGLIPNVPMKDSGVEWIGEIPEHWEVKPLKRLTSFISRGITPTYVDVSSVKVINQACIYWEKLNIENIKYQKEDLDISKGRLYKGDLVINSTGTGTLGRAAIFNLEGSCIADTHVTIIRSDKNSLNNRYLFYLLQTPKYQSYIYSALVTGATNQIELSREGLQNTIIICPFIEEQQAIANFLDQKTTEIDLLISDIKTQIFSLKEYRQSLITAAVTGKIDVRDYIVDNDKEEGEEQEEVS